jgi:hypothetical protein
MPSLDEEPPVNSVWASSDPYNVLTTITCPSGQIVKGQRLGMTGILSAGLLGDTDSLTAYVGKNHLRRVRGGKEADNDQLDMVSLMKDPEALKRIVFLMDRAVPLIVADPVVLLHFEYLEKPAEDGSVTRMIPPEERRTGMIYTDQVSFEDKMFLFQWCTGGSGNLTRFRGELDAAVEDLPDSNDVSGPALTGTPSAGGKRPRPRRRRR